MLSCLYHSGRNKTKENYPSFKEIGYICITFAGIQTVCDGSKTVKQAPDEIRTIDHQITGKRFYLLRVSHFLRL